MAPFNRENRTLPEMPFLVDEATGDLVGYLSKNGTQQWFPASGCDNALTAFAGGGQANAVQLRYRKSRVTTVGSAADSVKLPKAIAGMEMSVTNAAAANSMNVFPSSGEIIDAGAADAAVAIAANKTRVFHCVTNGTWHSVLTA